MKRLFGKAPVPRDVQDEHAPAVGANDATAELPAASPPPTGNVAFELREPTPEEMAAPILFEQDMISLDRLYSDEPVAPAAPAAPAPASEAELHGFFEHFDIGNFLGGWAGDHKDPTCRSLRVAALVDGQEVASAIADADRPDTPHGGFTIPFTDQQVPRLILDGRLTLQVSRPGITPVALPMLSSVVDQARSFFPPNPASQDIATPVPAATPPAAPKPTVELSYFPVPVGFVSPDRAAIVGREGFLFPLNDLLAQYAADPKDPTVQRDAAKWFALFSARQATLHQRRITYIQTIMPDRATVLGDLAPPGLGPVTARLGVLETMIDMVLRRDGPDAVAWYRSLIGTLRGFHGAGIAPFLRYDSRVRTAAAQLVFYQFVQKLAALRPDRETELMRVADYCGELKPGGESDAFAGDLGAHFALPLYESEKLPDLSRMAPLVTGKPVVARIPRQGEIGTRLMWRNAQAPSSLRIIAFGGSLFGRGDSARELSWWFKAMFAEFHFVWSSELDLTYLDQHKPDVVICQGAEDAMPVVAPR